MSLIRSRFISSAAAFSKASRGSQSLYASNVLGHQRNLDFASRSTIRLFSNLPTDEKKDQKAVTKAKVEAGVSKMKEMWRKYGVVFIGTYLGVYASTLGGMFLALDYDIFNASMVGLDPVAAVTKACDVFHTITGSSALPEYIRENPRAGTLAVAWILTKFTEPVRLGVSIAIVPTVARALGRAPPKEEKH